ncbi:MAG: ISL3 family transposase, partial [Paracoccaceae bacterium]
RRRRQSAPPSRHPPIHSEFSRSSRGSRECARGRNGSVRPRAHSLEPRLDRLNSEWIGGCRDGAELWRRLRPAGFAGSLRVVAEWATRQRRADTPGAPSRCPASRALARLSTTARDKLTRTEAVIVAASEGAVPDLVAARGVTDAFHALIRGRDAAGLDARIKSALASPLESFAKGVATDRSAIAAAIETPWSNGQTEGRICRLKTLKRQMGGRANVDLLKARMLPAA